MIGPWKLVNDADDDDVDVWSIYVCAKIHLGLIYR